ncbi:helix-turn-helix domain-containing protein [Geminicoccus flavidas]|uniref:helix-turn-helix domain-containing protein n=1 Tax=Geminicoccus flavidas TaxID=2506407 RepID=UPI001356818D|nr:helix-turn-helix transcriptional regulator [Geminicoccus flavidas]
MITPATCRAGRALLGWSQEALAKAACVGLSTLRAFETGRGSPTKANQNAIERALIENGIEFIPENGGGPGVRLRKPSAHLIETGLKSGSKDEPLTAEEVPVKAATSP